MRSLLEDYLKDLPFWRVYFLVTLAIYLLIVLPSLDVSGNDDIATYRTWADSITYLDYYREGEGALVSFTANLLGPVLIATLSGGNSFFIFIINLLGFSLASSALFSLYGLRGAKRTLYAYAPMTLFSIPLLNKEIIGVVGVILLMVYMKTRRVSVLLASLLVSLLCRWENALMVVVFLVIERFEFTRRRVGFTLLWLVGMLGISALYVRFSAELEIWELAADEGDTIAAILQMQREGWYWLVAPIKVAMTLFGNPQKWPQAIETFRFDNNLYSLVVLLQQVLTLAILVYCLAKRMKPAWGWEVRFIFSYVALFAVTPFIQLRYFFPLWPLFIAVLEGAGAEKAEPLSVTPAR